uniref:Uncharacterized protein n=1 Tax=Romanomermis culicivorax TaxID=13658 RepID=A0A915IXD0_ROMCU
MKKTLTMLLGGKVHKKATIRSRGLNGKIKTSYSGDPSKNFGRYMALSHIEKRHRPHPDVRASLDVTLLIWKYLQSLDTNIEQRTMMNKRAPKIEYLDRLYKENDLEDGGQSSKMTERIRPLRRSKRLKKSTENFRLFFRQFMNQTRLRQQKPFKLNINNQRLGHNGTFSENGHTQWEVLAPSFGAGYFDASSFSTTAPKRLTKGLG